MSNPLIKHPAGTVVTLPPRLFGSVAYYALMARFPQVYIDYDMRYDKRAKSTHRFAICGNNGPLMLTVPVSRPKGAFLEGNLKWSDILVSAHGDWWETMFTALASAYGRTPFFEFYIDRLRPAFVSRPLPQTETLTSLSRFADSAVRDILGFETRNADMPGEEKYDYRRADIEGLYPPRPYWQVRADSIGFVPGLSILDLIFNLGPEAPVYLHNFAD